MVGLTWKKIQQDSLIKEGLGDKDGRNVQGKIWKSGLKFSGGSKKKIHHILRWLKMLGVYSTLSMSTTTSTFLHCALTLFIKARFN